MQAISTIRYPGGKHYGKKPIIPFFPSSLTEMISPFLGGASIEIALAMRGVTVHGYDADVDLVNYWQYQLEYPVELAKKIHEIGPLNKGIYGELVREYNAERKRNEAGDGNYDMFWLAAVFWIINRFTWMGISPDIGGRYEGRMATTRNHQWNGLVNRISEFECPRLDVSRKDWTEVVKPDEDVFLYLDPPYPLDNYRIYKYDRIDHGHLAEVLNSRSRWILSYNDKAEIRDLYRDRRIYRVDMRYASHKKGKEMLIVSDDIVCPRAQQGTLFPEEMGFAWE